MFSKKHAWHCQNTSILINQIIENYVTQHMHGLAYCILVFALFAYSHGCHHGYPETIARSEGSLVDLVKGAIKYALLDLGYAAAVSDQDKFNRGRIAWFHNSFHSNCPQLRESTILPVVFNVLSHHLTASSGSCANIAHDML